MSVAARVGNSFINQARQSSGEPATSRHSAATPTHLAQEHMQVY